MSKVKHQVTLYHLSLFTKMVVEEWCNDSIKDQFHSFRTGEVSDYIFQDYSYFFYSSEALSMFLLRWSSRFPDLWVFDV